MTTPKRPYYYTDDSDVIHWEISCNDCHWPSPGWKITYDDNFIKEKKLCEECKDIKIYKWKPLE